MTAHRVVTAHIPHALAEEVDELSARLDRSRGWVLQEALEQYVELERRRRDLTKEALEDVRAGRVVAHAEIEAWAAGLRRAKAPAGKARRRR